MAKRIDKAAIQGAQNIMQASIKRALSKFTKQTGLIVPSVSWETAIALDHNKHVVCAEYYLLTSQISTGAGGA